ncbi:MAG: hypothetical protein K2P71_06120, partial [Lachnospiraceae bacterium]|nr:hypothetical protein [Lachnospiraceae bacterium]
IEREGSRIIRIGILDDGVGMKDFSRIPESGGGHGFGISNVSSYLTLLYGPSFGVSFEKNTPEGTVAIVRIPVPEPFI